MFNIWFVLVQKSVAKLSPSLANCALLSLLLPSIIVVPKAVLSKQPKDHNVHEITAKIIVETGRVNARVGVWWKVVCLEGRQGVICIPFICIPLIFSFPHGSLVSLRSSDDLRIGI